MKKLIIFSAALLCCMALHAQEPETTQLVDLGLSVKWAGYNIGASSPEESGDYFAWGETETKDDYSLENYKFCAGSYESMNKYCFQEHYGKVDGLRELLPEDDVASVKWGGKWRMPSSAQLAELRQKCKCKGMSWHGVNGLMITGPNGKSIFLPKAGHSYEGKMLLKNSYGFYFSRDLDKLESTASDGTYFTGAAFNLGIGLLREYGTPVRAVWEE